MSELFRWDLRGVFSLALLLGTVGCRGCDGETPLKERAAQGADALRRSRLEARRIDRTKTYPKADDGSVLCERDVNCFLVQSENCTPASVTLTDSQQYLGLTRSADARYGIRPLPGKLCLLTRETLAVRAEVSEIMARALREKGKSEDEIEAIRRSGLERTQERYPPKVECKVKNTKLLDLMLDLAEGKTAGPAWKKACRTVPGAVMPAEAPPPAAEAAGPDAAKPGEVEPDEAKLGETEPAAIKPGEAVGGEAKAAGGADKSGEAKPNAVKAVAADAPAPQQPK